MVAKVWCGLEGSFPLVIPWLKSTQLPSQIALADTTKMVLPCVHTHTHTHCPAHTLAGFMENLHSPLPTFFMMVSMHACMLSHFSHVQLFAPSWTITHQVSLSMGFSRQGYRRGLPCPPPGDLLDPGIKPACPASSASQADSLPVRHWGSPLVSIHWLICFFSDSPARTSAPPGPGLCPLFSPPCPTYPRHWEEFLERMKTNKYMTVRLYHRPSLHFGAHIWAYLLGIFLSQEL